MCQGCWHETLNPIGYWSNSGANLSLQAGCVDGAGASPPSLLTNTPSCMCVWLTLALETCCRTDILTHRSLRSKKQRLLTLLNLIGAHEASNCINSKIYLNLAQLPTGILSHRKHLKGVEALRRWIISMLLLIGLHRRLSWLEKKNHSK